MLSKGKEELSRSNFQEWVVKLSPEQREQILLENLPISISRIDELSQSDKEFRENVMKIINDLYFNHI